MSIAIVLITAEFNLSPTTVGLIQFLEDLCRTGSEH